MNRFLIAPITLALFLAAGLAAFSDAVIDVDFSMWASRIRDADGADVNDAVQDISSNNYHGLWLGGEDTPIVSTPVGAGVDTSDTDGFIALQDSLSVSQAWWVGTTPTPYFTLAASNSYTFETMLNWEGSGPGGIDGLMGQTGGTEWWVRENNGDLQYVFDDGPTRVQMASTNIDISVVTLSTDWHHVAVVLDRDQAEIRTYVDYLPVHTNSDTSITDLGVIGSGAADIRLGAYNATADNRFDGRQGRYRISDEALPPTAFFAITSAPPAGVLVWDNTAGTSNWLTDANWTGEVWDNGGPSSGLFNTSAVVHLNGSITQSDVTALDDVTLINTSGGVVTIGGTGTITGPLVFAGPGTLRLDHTGGWGFPGALRITNGTVQLANVDASAGDATYGLGPASTLKLGDGAAGSYRIGHLLNGGGVIESSTGAGNTGEVVVVSSQDTSGSDLTTLFRDGPDGSVLALRKAGTGTVSLRGTDANTFTGDVAIDAGVVRCDVLANTGIASTLGAGDTIYLGSETSQGQIRYHGGDITIDRDFVLGIGGGSFDITGGNSDLSLTGAVSGVELRKTGVGRVRLAGAQKTYTGRTLLSVGRIYTDADNVLPPGTGLEVSGGAFLMDNHPQTIKELYSDTSPGDVYFGGTTGTTLTIVGQTANRTFHGRLREGGDILWQPYGSGAQWALDGAGANDYAGTFTVQDTNATARLRLQKDAGGVTAINGDLFILSGQAGLYQNNQISDTASVFVSTNGVFLTRNFDETIGSLRGEGVVYLGSGASTLQVGANDSAFAFSGVINEAGEVVKVGMGTWTFSGRFTSGAAVKRVSGGTLLFNGADATGAWTVNTGGTLGGTGTLAGALMVDEGGAIRPGDGGTGTLNGASSTINGTHLVELSGESCGLLDLGGDLVLGSNSVLSVTGVLSKAFCTITRYAGTRTGVFSDISGAPGGAYRVDYDDESGRILLLNRASGGMVLILR